MRVCFHAPHAYPLFDPRVTASVGGMETRAWTLGRELSVRPDFDVHFVVAASRLFRRRQFENVTVWNQSDGFNAMRQTVATRVRLRPSFPWLGITQWHPSLLWQLPLLAALRPFRKRRLNSKTPDALLARINAAVYCTFGASAYSARVVETAKSLNRPSLLLLASNSDLDARFAPDSTYITPHGERADRCWYAIQNATLVLAQHSQQQRLLQERFKRPSIVLPNAIDLQAWDRGAAQSSPTLDRLGLRRFALWIGRADDFHKRPRLCAELARQLPGIPFLMILNPGDDRIEREVRATIPPNVTIVDSVPFAEMPALMTRAAVLVSTAASEYEGSPNVFLQAAASRIPIASLETASPPLHGEGAGFVARGDLERLRAFIETVWADERGISTCGTAGRREIEQRHAANIVIDQFAAILRNLTMEFGSQPLK